MAEGERAPGPGDVHDPAGFVAQLQALKDWSGLTYRELAARAEAVGDTLPRSTVANMLARATLPREELLVAFVRACGAGPAETELWLAARKHLAARRAPQPAPLPCACPPGACACPPHDGGPDGSGAGARAEEPETHRTAHPEVPDPETAVDHRRTEDRAVEDRAVEDRMEEARLAEGRRAEDPPADARPVERRGARDVRGWAARALVPIVGGVALVVAVTTVAAHLGADDEDRGPAAAPPVAGAVDIRAVHSGLCLNERRGQRSGQVYQVECADAAVPRYSLVRLPGGVWRIASDHPDFGPGCSGADAEVADEDGAPLTDQECGKRGSREVFRIEPPDGGPERGHRLRNAATGLCVTVPDASRAAWTPVVHKPCAPDGAGQLFAFPHRPADR